MSTLIAPATKIVRVPMDADAAIISPAQALPSSGQPEQSYLSEQSPAPSTESSSLLALANQPHSMQNSPPLAPKALPYSASVDAAASRAQTPNVKARSSKPSTPRPPATDSPADPQKSPEAGRALNVTDALSYLDAVKIQFQDKPEVYNRFLDIMKDFKSQVIDTPGVIQRVSKLFHGNPYLIQGFNTFLPMGYRIDVSADPTDPNTITVTTPSGTTTQNTITSSLSHSLVGTPTFTGAPPVILPHVPAPSRSHTPHPLHLVGPQPPFDSNFSPGYQNNQTNAAASVLGNMGQNNKNPVETQPAGEFNHAIHYLNKIKARYADDTNTYKQFLDILQTYQKEQRHLQDSQVYAQVQVLFKDAPDLLAEFKDFLPEAVGGQTQGPAILPQPAVNVGQVTPTWPQQEVQPPGSADKSSKKGGVPAKRKRRAVEKESTPVPPAKAAPSRAKKVKHHHKPDSVSASASFSPLIQPNSPQAVPVHAHTTSTSVLPPSLPGSHALQTQNSALPVGTVAGTPADKLLFFDRAKKSLENREMYEDFLKLLSLFSKEIIDIKTLVENANVFLGNSDLLSEFKDLIGWDDRQGHVENGPPGSIRTGPPEALSAMPADDGEGPSYRRLPDSEVRLACSGRDELCRSVLNDEWVSHPTWASEEAGFISHKKNSFEEALHKSEEERFEYHVHLEGLSRTIAVLEPLNNRIEEMSNEDRTVLKLKPDFGGPSKSIYHRIIKKVYGRDSGQEVIQALQDCPSVSVPVVLARLKQKDEEWRRAQREWSRTWRDVDSKNFYKSLDHQGISFKANDKKNITAKYFVTDIEFLKNQQLEEWDLDGVASFTRGSVGHQLEYAFHDTSTLLDSLKMVYSFLDRSQAHYSSQERRSVEKFLRIFIPLLCMYPVAEFNAACGPLEGAQDEEHCVEVNGQEGSRSGRRSVGSAQSMHSGGVAANDLRKKLLRTVQEKAMGKVTPTASRDASPSPEFRSPNLSHVGDTHDNPSDLWVTEVGTDTFTQNIAQVSGSERPFFANTTFYTLVRLLQLLYSRLLMCKEIGARHAAEKHVSLLANRVAVELGLDEPNGPPSVLEQTMDAVGDRGANDDANVVYMYLLNACEKLFDGDMDQATFEEHMRWFFGNKAYQLFTLDKLITALVKQVQTILSDNRCQELWKLLQNTQSSEIITNQDIVRYRREAERHVGQDDHLYRLQWVREINSLRVYLVGPDDPSVETDKKPTSRWRGYLDSYIMNYPTEWLPVVGRKGGPVFLKRCVQMEESATPFLQQVKFRVGLPSYKLSYESGTEDFAWHVWDRGEEQKLLEQAHVREERRRKALNYLNK